MKIKAVGPAVFMIAVTLFLLTACPSVYIRDCGELTAAASTLGIAHPPGYPLFNSIGHLFTYIPAGDIAFRVNLSCAVVSALAVLVFFLFLQLLGRIFRFSNTTQASFFSALLLAFSATLWRQATTADVHPLNTLLTVLLFYFSFKAAHFGAKRDALFFALFAGLGLAHHNTIGAAVIVTLAYMLFVNAKIVFDNIGAGLLLFLAGLSFYFYVLIRAKAAPLMNWGNPSTFNGMLDVFFRKQYGKLTKHDTSFIQFLGQLWAYSKSFAGQFAYLAVPAAIAGGVVSYKSSKRAFFAFLSMFLLMSVFLLVLLNPRVNVGEMEVVEAFFVPGYMMACIFVWYFLEKAGRSFKYIVPAGVVLVFLPLALNIRAQDKSNNYIPLNYGKNLLRSMPKDAIAFASQDNEVFILAYLKMSCKLRPDVTVYDDLGCVFENIYGPDVMKLSAPEHEQRISSIQDNIIKSTARPVVFLRTAGALRRWDKDCSQAGMLFVKGKGKDIDLFSRYDLSGVDDPKVYQEQLTRDISAQYYFSRGELALKSGKKEDAKMYFDRARGFASDISWVHNNIGVIYEGMGDKQSALSYYLSAVAADPISATSRYNLAAAYSRNGMLDEAKKQYLVSIKNDPNYCDSYNNLGNLCVKIGMKSGDVQEFVDARKYLVNAVELKPNDARLRFNLGMAYQDISDYFRYVAGYYGKQGDTIKANRSGIEQNSYLTLAETTFKDTILVNPGYLDAYNSLAIVYVNTGRKPQAISTWEDALRLDPGYKPAGENLRRIKAGH